MWFSSGDNRKDILGGESFEFVSKQDVSVYVKF